MIRSDGHPMLTQGLQTAQSSLPFGHVKSPKAGMIYILEAYSIGGRTGVVESTFYLRHQHIVLCSFLWFPSSQLPIQWVTVPWPLHNTYIFDNPGT